MDEDILNLIYTLDEIARNHDFSESYGLPVNDKKHLDEMIYAVHVFFTHKTQGKEKVVIN